jgi:hypothetical protein
MLNWALRLLTIFGIVFAMDSLLSAAGRQASRKTHLQMLIGETLPIAFLARKAQQFEDGGRDLCDRDATLGIALIELKLAEAALSEGRSEDADAHLDKASSKAKGQIACSPTNGYAWFVAFWSEFLAGNLTEYKWRYVDLSYRFAPHEAWVALIRLPLLARIWSIVPAERRPLLLDDFKMLVKEGYVPQCARLYAFAPSELRIEIGRILTKIPETKKQQFNASLRRYDVEPIATAKGESDTERLRGNFKALWDALGAREDR